MQTEQGSGCYRLFLLYTGFLPIVIWQSGVNKIILFGWEIELLFYDHGHEVPSFEHGNVIKPRS